MIHITNELDLYFLNPQKMESVIIYLTPPMFKIEYKSNS